jgi:integrase
MPVALLARLFNWWYGYPCNASKRNAVIAIILYHTAARYNELACLTRQQLTRDAEGYTWTLPAEQSKCGKKDHKFWIPDFNDDGQPIGVVLRDFLKIAPNDGGHVFRPTAPRNPGAWAAPATQYPLPTDPPTLSLQTFNTELQRALSAIIQEAPEFAGVHYTSHSLRKGAANLAAARGASQADVTRLLRHSSTTAVRSYVPAAAFLPTAGAGLALPKQR